MTGLSIPVSSRDHARGKPRAPVTLVEYGDYECPYCGEAYPIIRAVQRRLGDDLRFVFRNFPISELHPHAFRAAQFAEAAASSGRFWEAHDLLYEHQSALSADELLAYGQSLGLDGTVVAAGFDGCFDPKIRADFLGGIRSGVNGTPSLFINGPRYDGPRDVESLVTALRTAAQVADQHHR